MKAQLALALAIACGATADAANDPLPEAGDDICRASTGVAEYRPIAGGSLRSVLPADGVTAKAKVAPFLLRSRLVTNREFAVFLQASPSWRRGQVTALFATPTYLAGNGSVAGDAPVVHVSWYAAQAYCASENARLPRWYEWEFAAAADATRADARDDDVWLSDILRWYADAGKAPPGRVAATPANYYGIHDLHGLVWEWVEDYSGLFVNADSRASGDQKQLDYCGGAAVSLADRRNYAILMRLALLSAMEARQDGANLGFRCARDPAPNNQGVSP
ncbi:SUMF1/EgtB/PvdO family nonheme iron enzyme [Pseudoduganella sp. FT25W]|uniref:SUMF1/EgtB/PvdO family nonheme iron enzyme n=1 Tax=Duganella alba TaxID=2666081 RepID=A0A6L5QK97_9BURK|nr:formylglycine-generating enzyme family protein [Duganella alba]MRX10139.1 SUMF1/EgtB/PvdO family nonheme iron enzyme [Duganella alba]MRX16673.1 SUMF1/EgtB/PvdO family nonheme iron enzyme [Duganella alba]